MQAARLLPNMSSMENKWLSATRKRDDDAGCSSPPPGNLWQAGSTEYIFRGQCYSVKGVFSQLSVGWFDWYLGGWSGLVIATMPPGGAQISHQGALLEAQDGALSGSACEILRKQKISKVCQERWMSEQPEQWADDTCLRVRDSAWAKWWVSPKSAKWASNASDGCMASVFVCDSARAKRAMSAASGVSLAEMLEYIYIYI